MPNRTLVHLTVFSCFATSLLACDVERESDDELLGEAQQALQCSFYEHPPTVDYSNNTALTTNQYDQAPSAGPATYGYGLCDYYTARWYNADSGQVQAGLGFGEDQCEVTSLHVRIYTRSSAFGAWTVHDSGEISGQYNGSCQLFYQYNFTGVAYEMRVSAQAYGPDSSDPSSDVDNRTVYISAYGP